MPKQPPSVYTGDPRVKNAREQMVLNRLRQYLGTVLFNIPERMTTAERIGLVDPENHRFVWDVDLQQMWYWDGLWIMVGPGGGGLDELIKISVTDTTADFLVSKLVAGTGINLVPQGLGYETLRVDATGASGVSGSYLDGGVSVCQVASMQVGAPFPTVIPSVSAQPPAAGSAAQLAGFVSSVAGGVATVQYVGELGGFAGLIPEQEYFVGSVAGSISPVPPPSNNIRRKVGIAKDPTTLVIRIDGDYLIQA